jgi:hypothetical protein
METSTVARKKKAAEPGRKAVVLTIKGDPAWGKWIEEAASHCRMSVSAFVDIACAKYAKAEGFTSKPPERLP